MFVCFSVGCSCVLLLITLAVSISFYPCIRLHTSCALVTGVQTCALPIFPGHRVAPVTVSSAVRGGLSFLDSVAAALGARRILCGRLCAHHPVLGQGLSGDPA